MPNNKYALSFLRVIGRLIAHENHFLTLNWEKEYYQSAIDGTLIISWICCFKVPLSPNRLHSLEKNSTDLKARSSYKI